MYITFDILVLCYSEVYGAWQKKKKRDKKEIDKARAYSSSLSSSTRALINDELLLKLLKSRSFQLDFLVQAREPKPLL
jgi:hypothetical protein